MYSYIDESEYADFGIGDISVDKVDSACVVVDAYLSRPEGLTYAVDSEGYPIYMSRKLPGALFKLRADILPGTNVTVAISSGPLLMAGSALVLDRMNSALVETVYVTQVIDTNTIVLAKVEHAHPAGTIVESGMVVENTINVPKNRFFVTLPAHPLRRLVSAVGRIGYSRRGDMQGV